MTIYLAILLSESHEVIELIFSKLLISSDDLEASFVQGIIRIAHVLEVLYSLGILQESAV